MNKSELIDRMLEYMIDEGRDDPEDYFDLEPIDLDYAKTMVEDYRKLEDECDLTDDERIGHLVTPELMMEVFNCLVRANKFEVRTRRLAEWLTKNECVCEYDNYFSDDRDPDRRRVLPTDFLADNFPFRFDNDDKSEPTPLDLVEIGMNSKHTFHSGHEYCYYDDDKRQLFSTNTPFADGIINADAFARFILLDAEAFGYMFDHIIDSEDIHHILGCTKEEFINE